ncbi:MAG: hypothetical protein IPM29_26945 [Planctomycetes bacterium]|nr:hypothetical protein [Planctomycetota bacterium]
MRLRPESGVDLRDVRGHHAQAVLPVRGVRDGERGGLVVDGEPGVCYREAHLQAGPSTAASSIGSLATLVGR